MYGPGSYQQPKPTSSPIAVLQTGPGKAGNWLGKGTNWLGASLNRILSTPIPTPPQWLAEWQASWSNRDVTYIQNGRIFVATPRGTIYKILSNYWGTETKNRQGIIFRPNGSTGDANSIRIMEPNSQNPGGYFVVYISRGQSLDPSGSPGNPLGKAVTHIPENSPGDLPPGWEADFSGTPWPGQGSSISGDAMPCRMDATPVTL